MPIKRFNPALDIQVAYFPLKNFKKRNFQRALNRFAYFFRVDCTIEDVLAIVDFYDFSLGTTESMMFIVANGSAYAEIAMLTPEILELSIANEDDDRVVVRL